MWVQRNCVLIIRDILWKISEHCNGQRHETRKFACGYEVSWIPNYNREVPKEHSCNNDPELKLIKDKRSLAIEKLNKVIDELDVDKIFRHHLLCNIEELSYMIR